MSYTMENTAIVKDQNGNIVDFNQILSQLTFMQSQQATLKAKVESIYADVPAAVPQEVITAFNLN